ncbi:non-hydrolyzing UDP-N-acetylglucosamine 2-epimerase [Chloroflexota bacterium]
MEINNRKEVMVVFGTRPEATKMGPVVQALKSNPQWFETIVVVTGQHREQLYQALAAFGFEPDIDLAIMKEQQSLSYIVSAAIKGLDEIIKKEIPDLILVHGDTQTTVSAALASCYNKIPLAHVEAGLRSFKKFDPWPEEINRIITDSVADILLAPTPSNKENLLNMGAEPSRIFITGQTQVDAAMAVYQSEYNFHEELLNKLDYSERIILATAHRRENYGEPMNQMFRAMLRIADEFSDVMIVYPVHLSPIVQETARSVLSDHPRIMLLKPLEYRDMINLMARVHLVMSDSGGLQEECPVFNKPLVLMRETTERPEGIESGAMALCGTKEEAIYKCAYNLLTDSKEYMRMAGAKNPFGDGKASERIVNALAYYFGYITEVPGEFIP